LYKNSKTKNHTTIIIGISNINGTICKKGIKTIAITNGIEDNKNIFKKMLYFFNKCFILKNRFFENELNTFIDNIIYVCEFYKIKLLK